MGGDLKGRDKMNTSKIHLVVLVALAAALLSFAGTASATSLTSPTGTVATPTIKIESEGLVTAHAVYGSLPSKTECKWLLEGPIESHGEGKATVVPLTNLAVSSCTNSWHVTTVSPGRLEITSTNGYDGTVTWSGATIEMTRFGAVRKYKTGNTHMGTLTGGTPATVDVKEASLMFHMGGVFCGGEVPGPVPLTGSFQVSSPSSLFVDKTGTRFTSPTGAVATPTIKAESEGHVAIDHPLASFQCQWVLEGSVKSHNEGNAVVPLTSLTTSSCTDSWHATTVLPGELEVKWTSGYNATVTWSGGTVEMTRFGTPCRYKTNKTHLGTITGGSPATLHIEGKIPFHSGSSLCGEEAYPLTGSLKVTSPSALFVDTAS
jgi:hypothetical protein